MPLSRRSVANFMSNIIAFTITNCSILEKQLSDFLSLNSYNNTLSEINETTKESITELYGFSGYITVSTIVFPRYVHVIHNSRKQGFMCTQIGMEYPSDTMLSDTIWSMFAHTHINVLTPKCSSLPLIPCEYRVMLMKI